MNHALIKEMLIEAGKAVRQHVIRALAVSSHQALSAVHEEKKEDTIYVIDRDVEDILVQVIEKYSAGLGGIILLAEGIGDDNQGMVLPATCTHEKAAIKLIIDPIDGTRGLMYDKRSAFYLAGAAPNKGLKTNLSDIEVAVMVELPTSKQYKSDVLWAVKGKGSYTYTDNILTGEKQKKDISPTNARTILGGFAQLARFFPPGREILAAIEDDLIKQLAPPNPSGKALVFEDQYISSGGQLYELLMGHDRFVADVRGLLYQQMKREGKEGGHVCHPYDVCAHLIGEEAGIIITDGHGQTLNAPLDLHSEINWVGYGNARIEQEVKTIFIDLLKKYHLL
ncbi:inositol monophosphatase [Chryseotalea sanaruensis]|uniref:Inositol monophosphatase n=1 Tax=Chryseotalea sanaruensis TaxID=2482724 RepID=A0A401U627_9BACT|nr:inositol monophosphatase family protein [Chryseotalea sanaruensis]GCC50312.1 inositol monophosphatase [Chryseotalea sanaruensis]